MSQWGTYKARAVLAALLRIGWREARQSGSHRTLQRDGYPDYTWAFHEGVELGPAMMSKIAKKTGLTPRDL